MWLPAMEILLPVFLLSPCSKSYSSCISFHSVPSQIFYPSHCCCPCYLFVCCSLSDMLNCYGAGRMQGDTVTLTVRRVSFETGGGRTIPAIRILWRPARTCESSHVSQFQKSSPSRLCTSTPLPLLLSLLLLCQSLVLLNT